MQQIPMPAIDARQVSDALSARLRAMVQTAGGWLGFDTFMQAALYEPGLGYYTGSAARFGSAGDFVTAPGISPLFGGCIASACAQWFSQVPPLITEFGAGTGQLAAQVLNALQRQNNLPAQYFIIEVSGTLRSQQQHTLNTLAPGLVERVTWLDQLPQQLEGVVLANEVLDAMPVRLFELREQRVFERGLIRGRDDTALAWQSRSADAALTRHVKQALARAGWGGDDPFNLDLSAWPENYSTELGEQAEAWMRTVGERLTTGVILALDYGFPAAEFYHPQRATGTLACHYRHRVHHDPLLYPGLQDITAHVDFSGLTNAAQSVGLQLVGYTSQANFLLNAGLLDALSQVPAQHTVEYARQSQAVQKLVSEAEMGELFKAVAYARGDVGVTTAFARGDRSAALETPC